MLLILLAGCPTTPVDTADSGELATCDDIVDAFDAEAADIRACDDASECGQELTGTSCGCTRNWVARTDADTTRFYELLSLAGEESCDVVGDSTCDCPETYGFVCEDHVCNWDYTPGPPACDGDAGDDFDVTGVAVSGDTLVVGVGYSGGCETHEWSLCWPDQLFAESSPVQATLEVLHDANGDSCEAYISEDIALDLTPMRDAWIAAYGGSTGTMVLHVAGETVTYSF